MITTTLNRIKAHSPCKSGWEKLLKHLGKTKADDEPLPFLTILESNGLDDALWCCRAEPDQEKVWRKFICRVVRETPLHDGRTVWDLLTDERSRNAVEVTEQYIDETATSEVLEAARSAAWSAARSAASAASDAAWSAARSAASAASDAAWSAARSAARSAASAAAWSAWSASDAARSAASDAASDAAWSIFKELVS